MPKKKTKPPNPRQSSARAAGKRSGAPSSPSTEPPKRKRVTATGRELVGPDVWYSRAVADSLPMPPRSALVAVVKPRRRRSIKRTKARLPKRKRKLRKEPRGEVTAAKRSSSPAHQELVAPLLTCMAQVMNFSNSTVPDWKTPALIHEVQKRKELQQPDTGSKTKAASTTVTEEVGPEGINSTFKVRLIPTKEQRYLIELMFSANRAVYNRLVFLSRDDLAACMPMKALRSKYRPIFVKGTMPTYLGRHKRLREFKRAHKEVFESAYFDAMTAVRASRTQFFRMRSEGKKTTFPVLGFRSERARSSAITFATAKRAGFSLIEDGGKYYARFHTRAFGAHLGKGIRMSNPVATPEHMARLLRVRGGKYYFAFSTLKEFKQSTGTREGGMDPGVRKFGTVMDTEGLTLSVTDDGYLKRRYDAIDANTSTLAKLDNAAKAATKARHPIKLHTKEKVVIAMQNKKAGVSMSKSSDHRRRARLRREINATNLKITNAVKDFHHKFSSWTASNFKTFLLPSFQTSLMVRKYEQQMAADGTPESLSQFKVHRGRKRRILSSTARGMLGLRHYSFSELLRYKM
ncbi:hypothetical protein PR003_g7002 [Phytophthora rubi]|uniref:Transposase putative helix-turn-helix domain-containing protein n=1 Tax=Phytophthora rubi TaxID=129364 RepID=A0A6A4FL20_9STRA|nr:hypothetical protein PR003_g7002 [Phytophthora rubi]